MSDAVALMSGLVLEDGRRWGEAAVDWQLADAEAMLDLAPGAPSNHFSTRPRGGSKTTDVAGIALAALLTQLPPGSQSVAVAADRDQGRLLIREAAGFVNRTPGLAGAVAVDTFRITARETGATLDVLAADGASAYGLRPHLTLADEVANWPDTSGARDLWVAVLSAVAKVRSGRLVVLTTAGSPEHWSYKIIESARTDPRWRVSEIPGPLAWADPDKLADQRKLLTEAQYARLHLNRWTAAEDRLTSRDQVLACVDHDGPLEPVPGRSYVVGVDIGLKHDRTVCVVAHREKRERPTVVVDRIGVWAGTSAAPVRLSLVEEWLVEVFRTYRAKFNLDPYQAVGLAQRLRARGANVVEFTFSSASVGRLAATLYQLLRDGGLGLPDDPDLIDELVNVRLRETSPGVIRIDHDAGRHDDRVIALALAAEYLIGRGGHETIAAVPIVGYERNAIDDLYAGSASGGWDWP